MKEKEQLLVVKVGGARGLNLQTVCDDLANISRRRPLVVVHGVSARMDLMCKEEGQEITTLTSPSGHQSRYTSPAVRDIFVRAAKQENERIVGLLRSRSVNAEGLVDTNVLLGERKKAIRAVVNGRTRIIRDDHSGTIKKVDSHRLRKMLDAGKVPVIPPVANSYDDGLLNVDGDRASAAVAAAVNAVTQVILSNVDGLYRAFPDPSTLENVVPVSQIEDAMEWAQGRMKRKVLAAMEALNEGVVEEVIIANGQMLNAVSEAIKGVGTVFKRD